MYMLFEIADKYVVLMGVIIVVLALAVCLFLVLSNKNKKVKPINEDERYEEPKPTEFKKTEDLNEEQKKARMELERVFNQMSADLEKEPEKVVDTFEKEQEENAIISYQELIRQVKGGEPETTQKTTFELPETPIKSEPIETTVLSEIPKKEDYMTALEEIKPNIKALEIDETPKPYSGNKTKFSTSEIISPIFGRQADPVKETFNVAETYTALSQEEEEQKNVEFLQSLKEFRNNL